VYRTSKTKILLIFDQHVEYKRLAGAYPLRNFHKICRIYTSFQDALAVKVSLDLLKGLWSYRGFNVTVSGYPLNIQYPLAAKLCVRPSNVLEVQERTRGPLSPCQVWWRSDFSLSIVSPPFLEKNLWWLMARHPTQPSVSNYWNGTQSTKPTKPF